jgi:hypothetical protein
MTPRRPRPRLANRHRLRSFAPAPELCPQGTMDDPADRAADTRDLVAAVIGPRICHHSLRRLELPRLNGHS